MNRSAFLWFSLLTILICLVVPTVADVSAHTRAVHTYGIIEAETEALRTRRHLVVWGMHRDFYDQEVNFIALHSDILNIQYGTGKSSLTRIKELNPYMIILMYMGVMGVNPSSETFEWDVVNSHEDWFIHDKYGNRLQNAKYGWYCTDVGNQGWRNYFVQRAKQFMNEIPALDGIFAEDVWDSFIAGWGKWTVPAEDIPQSVVDRWHNDQLEFLRYVKQQIGDKLLILNTSNDDDYVDVSDGKWEEAFVHARWQNYGNFPSVDKWKHKIDGVRKVCQKGKMILVSGGCLELERDSTWTQAHPNEVEKLLEFCFCSYLLGVSGDKSAFNFGTFWNRDGSRGYYSIFDNARQLGSPVSDYDEFVSVYARDFENGKVLVNPSSSSYTVSLGGNYKTLDGQTVSSVTLGGHTALILLK